MTIDGRSIEECALAMCPTPGCGKGHLVANSETALIGTQLSVHCIECLGVFAVKLEEAPNPEELNIGVAIVATPEAFMTWLEGEEANRCPN